MKKNSPNLRISACFAAALMFLGATSGVQAALNASLSLRPLTPQELKTYALPNAQISAGINTIGIGEPAYLEALINITNSPESITNVVWSVTSAPVGSTATILPSPLGTNVPVYKPADKLVYRVAGRALLRPAVVGSYTVHVKVQTSNNGSADLDINLTAAMYLGVQACAACHSGNFANVPDIYHSYTNTPHASAFKNAINGVSTDHFSKNCISCHVVGYDTNAFASNLGFDDVANQYGWTFPTIVTNNNWDVMPSQLQNVANVQCENCHGPGSEHFYGGGATNKISISYAAADCSQCHDSLSHHYKSAEWNNSGHAIAPRSPSGAGREACVRCHTSGGFIDYVNNLGSTNSYTPNVAYEALTCQTCHDPHDASNPGQLRTGQVVPLVDGTVVTNAGAGGFCFNCHTAGRGAYTNQMVNYPLGKPTWKGGSSFGVHDSPQADMLEGVNAETYGKLIPNSPHANVVSDTCVGCHMQDVAATDPAFTLAGGHTTKMSYLVTNNSVVTDVPLTTVCTKCHGQLDDFDFPVADYNSDGVIEGVQTEVQHLLDKLSTLLPPATYKANANDYAADGLVKTLSYSWPKTNMPAKFLKAGYNWMFVNADGSKGIHNAAFAVGLLKASIGDLTGDNNNDGLPDAWQIAYFGDGFATNTAAGPNAINNTAGVPNWMMASMGLDPRGAFTVAGSGAIYINDGNIVNGATNTIAIYNAAEIAFDTQVGTSYQIQGISELTGAWSNISTNIPGTGSTISYLTPTRGVQQMFYRVVHTP
jgi:hypothetical protein